MKRSLCVLAIALMATTAFGQGAGWSAADFKAETDKVTSGQATLPTYATPEGKALLDQAFAPGALDRFRDAQLPLRQRLLECGGFISALSDFLQLYLAQLRQGRPVQAEFAATGVMALKATGAQSELSAQVWAGADKSPANQQLVEANKIKASAANLKLLGGWAGIAQESTLALSPHDRVLILQTLVDVMPSVGGNLLPADSTKLRYKLLALKVTNHDEAQGRLLDGLLARLPA